jgi:hypothetical protein
VSEEHGREAVSDQLSAVSQKEQKEKVATAFSG